MTDPLDRRPHGVDDDTVEALGKLSEALEYVIRVRGRLYDLHQLVGRADLLIGEAVDGLRRAGHGELADRIDHDVVGRNVLPGRWTYRIVEEFDDGYYAAVVAAERAAREQLVDGVRHVYEAEMRADRRTPGTPGHEPDPGESAT